ncbi:YdbH domain-containing protein, partial [Escherichia coli]
VDGKTAIVNLNYTHEENVFTLWRSLRFGDNLQAWLEQNTVLPQPPCRKDKDCEDK